MFIYSPKERRSKRRNEGRDALSASRSRAYFRSRRRSSAQTRSRKRREKRDAASKIEIVFPGLTHRKSFAAAAAAAEAEAARHRTKKGEVGTRSFEKRLLLLFFLYESLSSFEGERKRKRERERERERESACSYNRENWKLDFERIGKFVTFFYRFYPQNAINGFSSSPSSPPTSRFGVSLFARLEPPEEDDRVGGREKKRGFVPDARGPVFSFARELRNAIRA